MKTKLQLLRNDLATVVMHRIAAWQQFLIVSGIVFWAFFALWLARHFVLRSEWLTEQPPEDIPAFILCSCPSPKCPRHPHNFNSNNTATNSHITVTLTAVDDGDAS